MEPSRTELENLKLKVLFLEDENRLLKEKLEEAGISYEEIINPLIKEEVSAFDPNQGARIKKFEITDKIATNFFMMFCRGRKDVYELRYTNPKTGKTGYYTQCFNRWDRNCHIQKKDGIRCKDCELRAYKPLSIQLIKNHMSGMDSSGTMY